MDSILGNVNTSGIDYNAYSRLINNPDFEESFPNISGDIVEFGTCTGNSAAVLAEYNRDKIVFTIDHFQGLEETKQGIPQGPGYYSGWEKGAFRLGDPKNPKVPKTLEEVMKKLKPYPNITLIIADIHELKDPSHYNIGKIGYVNIDVDIYEPTVSSLKFTDRCEWNEIFIRFDDWHGHNPLFDKHERTAFKEWIEEKGYEYTILFGGDMGGVVVKR